MGKGNVYISDSRVKTVARLDEDLNLWCSIVQGYSFLQKLLC